MTPGSDGDGGPDDRDTTDPPHSDATDRPQSRDADRPIQADERPPVQYSWAVDDSPSTALLEAVAAETDRPPGDLPTLFDSVDGDALDALLLAARRDGAEHVRVTFSYGGFRIDVVADGRIGLRAPGGE